MAVAAEAQFHVLAVDDSLIDRKLIERLLKSSSFQVTTVDSGSKALELLGLQQQQQEDHHQHHLQQQQHLPNSPSVSSYQQEIEVSLVITDYCMPGMTGYDLLKKIKESSSLKDIPVVIMSSENVPSRINRCLEEGADEFLLKPVKLSDMKKLRPHIMKGKSKEHPQLQSLTQLAELNKKDPELQESHEEQGTKQKQHLHHHQQRMREQNQAQQTHPHLQQMRQQNQHQHLQHSSTQNGGTVAGTAGKPTCGNKRKAMDSSETTTSTDERPSSTYKVKGYGLAVV